MELIKSQLATHEQREKWAAAVLIILYTVGTVGFLAKIHPDFPKLTPLNLITSLAVVLSFHPDFGRKTYIYAVFCGVLGFLIELIGVNTGLIFGEYAYGSTLGFKLVNTPLSIAVNWLLLAYCSSITINVIGEKMPFGLKTALGALLMVGIDVLIEPVAMKTDMWSWSGNVVPLQNYVGWYFTALPMQALFFKFFGNLKNKTAVLVLVLQFLFFLILNSGYN